MDIDWLVFHPNPKIPDFVLPGGAVDAHCHVFGPSPEFPFAPERKYTPCNASKDDLFALRDHLGFSRNVIVQATCHGKDNSAMVDACRAGGDLARGIASVGADITHKELAEMHDAGVRGVRFNFVKRLVDATPKEAFIAIAEKIQEFGWSIVVYFEATDLEELEPFLKQLPGIVVVDHLGRPDVTKGVNHPDFTRFIDFMTKNENIWTKVTCPERLTTTGASYDEVVPYYQAIVDRFEDRVLWGTDWPHPNMKSHMPDDGALVDYIPRIARTQEQIHKLLVTNPMRLYWTT
ncbi:amidohydrolase family protein [bacterium]|nr:amidohydrolase family protein [bacterium]MDB4853691.1 amidohydrolase family protein [Planktomarina temperata]MDA9346429.1 amidohydrolase family protein [bacterium]MDA9955684.1 amidohydrolase family protein [bacterium]MDC0113826.1 amidohydrolase family protein [Planktomarina temperata]